MRRTLCLFFLAALVAAIYFHHARIVAKPFEAYAAGATAQKRADGTTENKAAKKKTTQGRSETQDKKPKRLDLGDGRVYTAKQIDYILDHTRNGKRAKQILEAKYKGKKGNATAGEIIADVCARRRVHSGLLIAMLQGENNLGKLMVKDRKHFGTVNGLGNNWGSLKRNSDNFKGSGAKPMGYIKVGKGPYAIFRTPKDGLLAYAWVIRTVYLDQGRRTVSRIIQKYAPSDSGEGNNPGAYTKSVEKWMKQYDRLAKKAPK